MDALGKEVDVLYLDGDYAETGFLEKDNGFYFTIRYPDGYAETFWSQEYKYSIK